MGMLAKFLEAAGRRLGRRCSPVEWREMLAREGLRRVPPHVGWEFTLGWGIAASAIALFLSGLMLTFYYRPTPREAYESVSHIADNARCGWLVLQTHRWGSHLLVLFFLLFLMRDFWLGAYKFPRDWVWCLTVGLFLTALGLGFTGRILPWDQHAYHATTVATEIIRKGLGIPGDWLCALMRGGRGVSGETLTRFYVVHILLLPAVFLCLLAVRAALARATGTAPLASVHEEKETGYEKLVANGPSVYPFLVVRQVLFFFLVLTALFSVVVLFPLPLGDKADPASVPDLLKPEWYFLPLHQLTKYLPVQVCAIAGLIAPALLFLLPILDRSPEREPGKRGMCLALASAAILLTLLLGTLGHLSGRDRTYFGVRVRFSMSGMPEVVSNHSQGQKTQE